MLNKNRALTVTAVKLERSGAEMRSSVDLDYSLEHTVCKLETFKHLSTSTEQYSALARLEDPQQSTAVSITRKKPYTLKRPIILLVMCKCTLKGLVIDAKMCEMMEGDGASVPKGVRSS